MSQLTTRPSSRFDIFELGDSCVIINPKGKPENGFKIRIVEYTSEDKSKCYGLDCEIHQRYIALAVEIERIEEEKGMARVNVRS